MFCKICKQKRSAKCESLQMVELKELPYSDCRQGNAEKYNRVQPVAGTSLHRAALPSVLPKKQDVPCRTSFLVELRGVEPLSEKLEAATSTYLADCCYSL